ncbi:hypothetical protein BLOT_007349 [Blomia tropicalis]|nr:hypothetical protein BLOT_007349 [Blomia tropicalis]
MYSLSRLNESQLFAGRMRPSIRSSVITVEANSCKSRDAMAMLDEWYEPIVDSPILLPNFGASSYSSKTSIRFLFFACMVTPFCSIVPTSYG